LVVDCQPIGVEYQRVPRGGARHARETVIPPWIRKRYSFGRVRESGSFIEWSTPKAPTKPSTRKPTRSASFGSTIILVVSLTWAAATPAAPLCDAQGSEDVMCKVRGIRTLTLGNYKPGEGFLHSQIPVVPRQIPTNPFRPPASLVTSLDVILYNVSGY
jgi:hypothetical protein